MGRPLPGLLDGLEERRVPSFKTLVHLSSNEFYDDPPASTARRKALTQVLGAEPDSFRPEWEKFVEGLSAQG